MKVELNAVSSVKKVLKVEVGADVVQEARQKALQEVQKKAKLPGFREGKIPSNVLQQKFTHDIDHQTIDAIVDLSVGDAFKEAKTFPINRPELTPGMWLGNGGYTYTLTFEVLPEFQLKDYKGLKLEKEEIEVSSEEINQEMKRLQEAMTQLEPLPKETKVADGHVVQLDFEGKVDGKKFEGGDAKDLMAEIGSGQMLKDFENQIKGATVQEEIDVAFQYPKDYFNKDLAGKKGEFKVKVKDIRKKSVPELNDDFAKDLGNFKTLVEVQDDVKKRIERAKEYYQKTQLSNQVIAVLVEKHSFEIPESLVHSELRSMLERFAEEVKRRGQKLEEFDFEKLAEEFKPEAQKRVRGFLLVDAVAKDLKLEVSEKEMADRLDAIAKSVQKSLNEVKAYYEKNRLLGSLQTQILHEKALENVVNEAKIKVVKPKMAKKSKK